MHGTVSKEKEKETNRVQSGDKPLLVVGKIYADWCGHCKNLTPKWKIFGSVLSKKFPANKKPIIYEIEETNMNDEAEGLDSLTKYLADPTEKVSVNGGYPTIFKIVDGKISYYEGPREVGPMIKWTMDGLKVHSNKKHTNKKNRRTYGRKTNGVYKYTRRQYK
jgi:thiol-disulfide isomerase/thioredoxin